MASDRRVLVPHAGIWLCMNKFLVSQVLVVISSTFLYILISSSCLFSGFCSTCALQLENCPICRQEILERRELSGYPGKTFSVCSVPVSAISKDSTKDSENVSYNAIGANLMKDIDLDAKDRTKLKNVKSGRESKTGIDKNESQIRTVTSVENNSTKSLEFSNNGATELSKDTKLNVENEMHIDTVMDSIS